MTFRIVHRGAPREIAQEFRCPVHGVFTAFVSNDVDEVPCPAPFECTRCGETTDRRGDIDHREDCDGSYPMQPCGASSPWTPSVVRFKVAIVATRGKNDVKQHKGWLDTTNLEEGQSFEEYEAERDAVAEELRKDLVMEAVRSDR